MEGKGLHSGVDMETLSQAEAYITAGCSFAIGLRFAGSHNKKAQQCLVRRGDWTDSFLLTRARCSFHVDM